MASPRNNHRPAIAPGQVWWCDGAALGFEAYFKRRPVLVLTVGDDDTLLVAPLSSKRRFGQEHEVTHDRGVSYLTGTVATVPTVALDAYLGDWPGFPAWRESQQPAPRRRPPALNVRALLERIRRKIRPDHRDPPI